ncbi:MAG TPA: DUF502 domain-containing protein [Chitinophagaceae bacterium]|nr:DUF502 domain-containing protein [Chitinophagaceae bacterium]
MINPAKPRRIAKLTYKKILHYFLQGVIILAPIAVTASALYWIFEKIDSILRPYIQIPGIGFIAILVGVFLIGWISNLFLMGRLIDIFNHWLERTPGVKFIYSSMRDFFEAFAGDKKKFDKPVLINIDAPNVWRIGFLTNNNIHKWGLEEHVAVYVPYAYSLSGAVYMVPKNNVRTVNISAGEAMKFAISGGVATDSTAL